MRTIYSAAFVVLAAAGPAIADVQSDFASCAQKTGPEYVQARDQFLAASDEAHMALVRQKLASHAWRDRLEARILRGWLDHRPKYSRLIATPKRTNQSGVEFYPWSLGSSDITGNDIPLLYELLTKDIDLDSANDAVRSLLGLIQREPNLPLDVRVLHELLRDQATAVPMRRMVVWFISSLPVKYQDQDDLSASLKAELARKDVNRSVLQFLLQGLGHAADGMSPDEKDSLVTDLLNMPKLEAQVGKVALIYAIAGIGGDKASQAVATYLKQTQDQNEKRWALDALSRADSKVGTDTLLKYAGGDDSVLRHDAIQGLGRLTRAQDGPEVVSQLGSLAMDKGVPESQQLQAFYSLAKISARHSKDKDLQREIRSRLQLISAAKSSNEQFQNEVDGLLRNLRQDAP